MMSLTWKSRKCKFIYTVSERISGYLGMGVGKGRKKGIIEGNENFWDVHLLIVTMV